MLGDLIGGDDTLEGGRGQDLLYGQRGNDTYLFWGDGLGTDFVAEAGAGNTEGSRKESFDAGSRPNDLHDRFDFSEFNGPVSIDLGKSGLKKINSGITDGDVNLQLKWFSNKTIEDIVGSQFADRLEGNGRDNVIIGLDGDDRIFGRSGDDVLLGGDSEDDNGEINREINGDDNGETNGDGNDKIGGGAGDDIIDGGDGDDTLHGDGGSDVILGGDGNDIIRGMRGNDFIDGEGGNDRIEGRAGQDVLLGGDGDDILRGGKGEDSVEGGDGDDDIREGGGRSSQEAGGVPLDPLFEAFDEVYEPANDFYDPQPEDDRSVRPWIEDYLDLVTGGIPSTGGVGLAATDGQSIGLFDTLVAMFEPASMAGGALGSDLQTRVFHEELDAVIDLEEAKQLEQVTGPVEMADLAEAEEELILPGWIPGRVAGSTGFSAEVDMAAGQQLAEGETADVPPVEAGVLDGLSVDWSTKFPGFLSNV